MQIHQDHNNAAYAIRSMEPGKVTIVHPITAFDDNGKPLIRQEVLTCSTVIMADQLLRDWPVANVDGLTPAAMTPLAELPLEVVLLGTGDKIRFPKPEVTAPLLSKGIGVEVMDVGAACRTYNILMAEGRKVAAALILE